VRSLVAAQLVLALLTARSAESTENGGTATTLGTADGRGWTRMISERGAWLRMVLESTAFSRQQPVEQEGNGENGLSSLRLGVSALKSGWEWVVRLWL